MDNAPAPSAAPAPSPAPAEVPAVGDVLTAATGVTLDNAGLLFGVWAVCHFPAQALGFVVGLTSGLQDKEAIKTAIQNHDFGMVIPLAVVGLVGMVLGLLGYASTILLAAKAFRGQAASLGDLLVEGAGRMLAVVAASLLVGLCVGFGTLALILPGLYLVVRLSLVVCATCVDGRGPVDAFGRGWRLTGGRFWDVLVFVLALFGVGLVAAIGLMAAGFMLGIAGSFAGAAGSALAGLVVNLAQFMVSAWGSVCMTKFYMELSARTPD